MGDAFCIFLRLHAAKSKPTRQIWEQKQPRCQRVCTAQCPVNVSIAFIGLMGATALHSKLSGSLCLHFGPLACNHRAAKSPHSREGAWRSDRSKGKEVAGINGDKGEWMPDGEEKKNSLINLESLFTNIIISISLTKIKQKCFYLMLSCCEHHRAASVVVA